MGQEAASDQAASDEAKSDQSTAERRKGLIEEIIVTARKRDEDVQDVPLSMVVASSDTLKSASIDALNELHRIAPNLVLTEELGGAQSSITLRGIGTFTAGTEAIEPSVATVVDGVVSGTTGGGGVTNFSDLDRIEVLRGPQGTLFGKNSSGGLVHILTKDPTDTFSANVGARYGTYDEIKVDGAVSGSLIDDKLLGRLSYFASKRDGYIENLLDGRMIGDDNQVGVRGKLLFTPWDTTQLKLTVSAVRRDQDDSSRQALQRSVSAEDPDLFGQLLYRYLSDIASETNDKHYGIGRVAYEDDISNVSLQWDQTLGDFTLTSVSAYSTWSWDTNPGRHVPADNHTPEPFVQLDTAGFRQHQWSQEVRLASPTDKFIDYVLGIYLFDQSFVRTLEQRIDLASLGIPIIGVNGFNKDDVDTWNYAAFGEANIHITDEVTLIAGARWTHEEKQFDHKVLPPEVSGDFTFGASGLPDTTDEVKVSDWTWRVGARWEPNANSMMYVTVSTGFKGPAYNTNATVELSTDLLRVAPETSTSYEAGWKTTLLDDRLSTSLAVFYTELEDFQAETIETFEIQDGLEGSFALLTNAGKVVSKGVELELQAAPTDNLLFNLNAAYTDAKYDQFVSAPCFNLQTEAEGCLDGRQDLSGTRLPRAPRWSFNTNAQYDFPIAQVRLDGFVRVEYSWRDNMDWSFRGEPNATEDPVGLLGASIGVSGANDRYALSVYGKNLTDEFNTNGIVGGKFDVRHYLTPYYQRTFGIRFDYNFH